MPYAITHYCLPKVIHSSVSKLSKNAIHFAGILPCGTTNLQLFLWNSEDLLNIFATEQLASKIRQITVNK